MNTLDWVLLIVGLFAVLRGAMRGAISQVFGITGIVAGFLTASHFYLPLSRQLTMTFSKLTPSQAHIIAFVVLFFLAWLSIAIVGFWVAGLLRRVGLGFVDRFWGAILGLAKSFILAVILISALTFLLSPKSPLLSQSYLTPYVQDAARYIIRVTPERVQSLFKEKQEELKRYWINRKDV